MDIKDIFGEAETMTYEQFTAAAKEKKANFVDLSTGDYVSKNKYNDELKKRDTNIDTLKNSLSKRDDDIKDMQKKLSEVGDAPDKVASLTQKLGELQSTYDTEKQDFEAKLSAQAYEFAVKDYANTKKFTSKAAKRDFVNEMLKQNLTVDGDKIIGADDFAKKYSEENEDAFEAKHSDTPAPQFGAPTPGLENKHDKNAFDFNFTGVRAKK